MRHHGKDGAVMIAGVRVASLNKWNLNMATDKADVTSFGDKNKVYVQGLKDLKGTVSGFWDDEEDALFDAVDGDVPVDLALYPVETLATKFWSGPAWLDAQIEVPSNGAATVQGSFVAAGSWTHT
jgi:hypothetical protein